MKNSSEKNVDPEQQLPSVDPYYNLRPRILKYSSQSWSSGLFVCIPLSFSVLYEYLLCSFESMPRLKSCFGIIPLRQACFIIGFYHIVLYSFFVIMSAHNVELMPMLREYDHLLSTLIAILLSAIDLVSAVLLIIGIGVENKNLLRPWMVAIPISIIYDTMYTIYSLMDEPDTDIDPTFVMLTTIGCLLNVYFLFVVGSQFQIYRKNYEQRKNNFRSIAPKADMDMIEQYDSRYPRHSDVSQDYSDGDQADNHSINPSHTSVVSTELFGVPNGKRNSSGSCECLSVNIK